MDTDILYKNLRDRLMADPQIGLKHFALEAEQMESDEGEDSQTYPKPAAILQITNVEPKSIGNGLQLTKVEFSIKLICEVLQETSSRESDNIQNLSLNHLALLNAINKRLHKWSVPGISTIGKMGKIIGSVADNVVEHELSYRCTMKDVSAEPEVLTAEEDLTPFQFRAENNSFNVGSNETITLTPDQLTDNQSGLVGTITSIGSPSSVNINATLTSSTLITIDSISETVEIITLPYTATNGVVTVQGLMILSVKPLDAIKSGIEYLDCRFFYSTTSLYTYDEVWRYNNNRLNNPKPDNPLYKQELDLTLGTKTLLHNNIYGNKERYTDLDGGQVYDKAFIDHLTGRAYYYEGFSNQNSAEANIIAANNFTLAGDSNWLTPTLNEYISLQSVTADSVWFYDLPWRSNLFNPNNKGYSSCTFPTNTTVFAAFSNSKHYSTLTIINTGMQAIFVKLISEL